jgi:N-acetylmuramoyl-L-alanine amidase
MESWQQFETDNDITGIDYLGRKTMDSDLRRRQERQRRLRRRKQQIRMRLALIISVILLFAVLLIKNTAQQRDIQTFGFDAGEETEESEQEDRGVTVVIDAGHGGKDQGCAYGDVLEKDINLEIALLLERKLENAVFCVVMTRDDDTFVSLNDRVEAAEDAQVDAFVSIHVDSYPDNESVNGVTVHYETGADGGKELANVLYAMLGSTKNVTVRNLMESDLYVLRNTTMPATLVETGYITNSTDRENLQSRKFLDRLTDGIYEGIDTYFSENGGQTSKKSMKEPKSVL